MINKMSDKEYKELVNRWETKIADKLVGKKIKAVEYLTEKESNEMMWNGRPIIIIFDDDSYIFPMSDDEGNDAGALATSFTDLSTIPVI